VKNDRFWIHGLAAGATAGVLAQVLVVRLNPEVAQPLGPMAIGVVLWASWGVMIAGLPLVLLQVIIRRLRRSPSDWPAPALTAAVYFVAAVLGAFNSDLHLFLLSRTANRVVLQDAVAWALGALLALVAGAAIRRLEGGARAKVAFALVMLLLPAGRLAIRPTTSGQPLELAVQPIGLPTRPLLVIGIEGLDGPVLLTYAGGGRTPALERLMKDGAWGTVEPYEPYLRQSYWTSVATGTYPGAHGVKSHWGWNLPLLFDQPLRLLPWTPQGSRLILPWSLAERVTPPPCTVPTLWQRLRASGVDTEVLGWPGIWDPRAGVVEIGPGGAQTDLEVDLRSALETALLPFPDEGSEIWRAIDRDQANLKSAVDRMGSGVEHLWVHLGALTETRELLEPLKPRHTGEREVVELVVELLDSQLGELLTAAPPDALVVVVSPNGLSPPSSYERLRRLVGIGDTWRTSGDRCWDGILMVLGRDVAVGRRYQDVRHPDVVPTLCYLLGLPLAQYMEGEVIIEAVDPSFLATHPLVVDP
jgi:hypothetical protein